jgi:hypothetical protein
MSGNPNSTFSADLATRYPGFRVGLITARDLDQDAVDGHLNSHRNQWFRSLRDSATDIEHRVSSIDAFFSEHEFACPLPQQLTRTLASGLPRISPLVDALLITEMTSGALMGLQDLDKIEGDLLFDVATGGETFGGFRSDVTCRHGEIVIRDSATIIASYFQGPDKKTAVDSRTTAVAAFVFAAPTEEAGGFEEACRRIEDVLRAGSSRTEARYLPD